MRIRDVGDLDVGRPGTTASVDQSTGARPRRARTIIYNIKAFCIMRRRKQIGQ